MYFPGDPMRSLAETTTAPRALGSGRREALRELALAGLAVLAPVVLQRLQRGKADLLLGGHIALDVAGIGVELGLVVAGHLRALHLFARRRNGAKATQPAPASGGGFLSSIFGGGSSRDSQPAQSAPASSGGGWREPARPSFGQPAPQQQNYGAPQQNYQQPQQAPAAPIGSGFLGGALKTAAGVAGGVMLAEGISSLFNHNSQQPQVVEEIIREEPAPASDNSNWGNDDQKFAGNDSWGNDTSSDSFAGSDYSDDSSSFGDDDSFV